MGYAVWESHTNQELYSSQTLYHKQYVSPAIFLDFFWQKSNMKVQEILSIKKFNTKDAKYHLSLTHLAVNLQ